MKKEYFEILLESVDSKMQLLLDGFGTLDAKIDRLDQRLTERFDRTHAKLDQIIEKLDLMKYGECP